MKTFDLASLVLGLSLIAWAGFFYHIPMLVVGLTLLVGRQVLVLFARYRYGYEGVRLMSILDAIAAWWPL